MYVSRKDTWEHIAKGHVAYGVLEVMERKFANHLAEWEARWATMGGR